MLGVAYPWVAHDLDQAVQVFGEWVDRECEAAYQEVLEDHRRVQEARRRARSAMRGSAPAAAPPPYARARDAYEGKWWELVRGVRRWKTLGRMCRFDASGRRLAAPFPTAVLTWEQPVFGDERDRTRRHGRLVAEHPMEGRREAYLRAKRWAQERRQAAEKAPPSAGGGTADLGGRGRPNGQEGT